MICDILWESEVVGTARVIKKGLYYEICCRDSVSQPHIIELFCGRNQVNLGICVPIGNVFGFSTQIPIKRVGDGPFRFCAIPVKKREDVVLVREDKPFPHISQLKNAYCCVEDNEVGIKFRSESQDRSDSDQIQKYQRK